MLFARLLTRRASDCRLRRSQRRCGDRRSAAAWCRPPASRVPRRGVTCRRVDVQRTPPRMQRPSHLPPMSCLRHACNALAEAPTGFASSTTNSQLLSAPSTTTMQQNSPRSHGSSPRSTKPCRRQSLRLEEYDDPRHPVVAAAKTRIEELAAQRAALEDQRHQLASDRADKPQPHEIEALLASIPDLRPALAVYGPHDLADLFDAFNITVTYDKPAHTLELAATVTAELVPAPERLRPPRRRSQNSDIAGAGFEPATSGL